MTESEYIKQNKLGFEGDLFARNKFQDIIESNGINTVVETGTYLGSTTRYFAQWADIVHTIEINKYNYEKAKSNLYDCSNVKMHFGNSSQELAKVIATLDKSQPVLFFLDAHWEDYNPLLAELKVIALAGLKPFIAIHDFKVPNKPELGFDSYKGQDYEWDWIKAGIEEIYDEGGYKVEYNSEASGAKRGIIYISPNDTKYTNSSEQNNA